MRLHYVLTALLCGVCCAESIAGRGRLARKRQDDTDVTTTPTTPESSLPSSVSPTTEPAPSSTEEPTSTLDRTDQPASASDFTTSSTVSPTSTSITEHDAPTRTDAAAKATETAKEEAQLPIQPIITPATGIAGVILIGTGIAFCLIGIKHQWLHVYLSAAYSTALAVAVLIVYVMTPPISNAIQGAYLVAAVITGLIFGALSLVFKEITEGLGCLIGGFCLAMCFMVLRPGGLVQSESGRPIMIGVFCVAGLSLSFSQYTRNYGLIGCTAFAGAMATVLGIDCFSRAGLKEFWLYIWNLNDDLFPIGTHTYPITRGIRVEIAVTVIIFLFGLMSQLKIWVRVKEHREKKEAQQLAADESRDQLAGEVGQDVEALNERQRAQWEAIYGNGSKPRLPPDSGVGTSVASTHKKSASVTTREVDAIEMEDVEHTSRRVRQSGSKQPAGMTVKEGNTTDEDLAGSARWSSRAGSQSGGSPLPYDFADADQSMPVQQPGGPEVVPLPFSPPAADGDAAKSDAGSAKSRGTAGTELNPLTLKQHNAALPSRLPRIEHDRASSIAATADDEPDVGDSDSIRRRSIARPSFRIRSTPQSEAKDFSSAKDRLLPEGEHSRDRSQTPSGRRTPQEAALDDEDEEALVRPQTAHQDSETVLPRVRISGDGQQRKSSITSQRRSTGSRSPEEGERADRDADASSAVGSLTDHLPEGISKVAMAYRTNEWAKHITDADQPDDLPQEPDSPGIQVDTAFQHEAAKPVDTVALSEVPVVTPSDTIRKPSKRPSKNSYRRISDGLQLQRQSSATPVYAFQRTSSQQSLMRQSSNGQLKRETRTVSTPYGQPLVESPIEQQQDPFLTPITSSNNLLNQRNDRLKRKTTTTNFNALNVGLPEPHASNQAAPAPTSPGETFQPQGEDMTLAQRKSLIQQQQLNTTSQPPAAPERSTRRSSGPAPGISRKHSASNPHLIYDSHQPKRSNTVDTSKQNATYKQWRSSLQQTNNKNVENPAIEAQARQHMMQQRENATRERERRQEQRLKRESAMDVAMRMGQLNGAHNDVLRRMQAKANESAK